MNSLSRLNQLFQKLSDNSITKAELDEFLTAIDKKNNTSAINDQLHALWKNVKELPEHNLTSNPNNSDQLFISILDRLQQLDKKETKRKQLLPNSPMKWVGLAASMILIAGLLFFYQNQTFIPTPTEVPIETIVENNSNVITLKLDNGTVETISENGERTITTEEGAIVGSQQGTSLNYLGNELNKELVYNTLSIPNGKRFDLTLSDGTKVTLNSGSTMRYPVQFIPGKNRKVFLMGEAYFEITKDANHPFIVNADDLEVQVLGTQFNLSHYPEDQEVTTVLVEGSVELHKQGANRETHSSTMLRPGQLAAWKKSENKMSIHSVDTEIYTAWKEGYLLFKAAPFSQIESRLERHFNIIIENRSSHLAQQIYTATFKEESIEEILEAFKEDISFAYVRQDRKIIITNI